MVDLVERKPFPVSGRKRLPVPGLTRPSHIRVRAANERIRVAIKHATTHVGFMPDIGQSVEWPLDQFTKRRILDGTVLIDEGGPGGEAAAAMFKHHKVKVRKDENGEQPHNQGRSPRRRTAETHHAPSSSST